MVSTQVSHDELWQMLWAQTAQAVIVGLPRPAGCELFSAGNGWGLRQCNNPRRALLLHSSGTGRPVGDLSLTLLDRGTHPIARYDHTFPDYLAHVEDVVTAAAADYFAG